MSEDKRVDPDTKKRIIKGSRGSTTTLLCKKGETAIACAKRHEAAGWNVPGGYKLGTDKSGRPVLEW